MTASGIGATAARHEFGLPLDIMTEILGHTPDRDGHAPAATSYYLPDPRVGCPVGAGARAH